MKRTDIKAGVVYAYQRSRGYGPPEPIVFLAAPSDGKLYTTHSSWRKEDRPAFSAAPANSKPGRSGGSWDTRHTGYPVAILTIGTRGAEADPAELLKLKLEDFERVTNGHNTGIPGAYFTPLATLGQVTGLYEEKLAEYEAEVLNDRAERQRIQERAQARRDRAHGICDKFTEVGVTADTYGDFTEIHLSLDEAEKLLALLAAEGA